MFTVKLASGEAFPVTAAEQRFFASEGTGQPVLALQLEAAPADHELDWYLEKLDAPGALDQVQVLEEDGGDGFPAEAYGKVANASMRLLAGGGRAFSLTLAKG